MPRRILLLLGCVFVAACAGSPTQSTPADPSLDGGWTIGSGGRADSPPAPAEETQGTQCAANDSGGWTIGSGGATATLDECGGR